LLLFGGKTRSTLTREDAAERRVGDAVVVVRNATRDVESFVQPVPQPGRDALRGSGGGVVIGQFGGDWSVSSAVGHSKRKRAFYLPYAHRVRRVPVRPGVRDARRGAEVPGEEEQVRSRALDPRVRRVDRIAACAWW
jgi:hypothetical protein